MASALPLTFNVPSGSPLRAGIAGSGLSGLLALDSIGVSGGFSVSAAPTLSGSISLDGIGVSGAMSSRIGEFTVQADGIWTWFTRPEALQVGNRLYIGWVNKGGTCGATQLDLTTMTLRHMNLSAVGLEIDDHNNTSFVVLPNGHIAAFYGAHNDSRFRYRIYNPAGAFDSAASWTTEQARGSGSGPYSYPNPIRFSQDSPRCWLFSRRWTTGDGGTRALSYRTVTDLTTAAPHSWSVHTDVYRRTGWIPYWRTAHDGVRRVHFAITDGHPVQGQTSLYHFYGELNGSNVMQWFKSDGVQIVDALPLGPASLTQVYDGSSVRCWVSDIVIDADGRPRILWMRYPGNNGTQIEYWHSRWTGSTWSNAKITDDGAGLYTPEVYYHGGLAFDRQNVDRVYLSAPISGVRQIQEWRTTDNGATWSQQRVITSGGSAGNPLRARPIGVVGGDGRVRVAWWEGRYTTFEDYDTSIKASG